MWNGVNIHDKTDMEILYNDFRHYGEILDTRNTTISGKYYTAKEIKYNNQTVTFLLCNGEVVGYNF